MNGLLLIVRSTFVATLRGRRAFALLALCGLPLLFSWANMQATEVGLTDFIMVFLMTVIQVSAPFGALLLGAAVLGDEIDGRTITYLFTRPIRRSMIFLGRLAGFGLAYALLLALTVGATAWLFSSRVSVPVVQVVGAAGIAVAGMATYLAFFATLRALFKKAIFIGFAITFILEVAISKLPGVGSLARISIWHHMAVLTVRLFEEQPGFKMPEMARVDYTETAQSSLTVMAVIFVVSLLLGMRLVRTREYHVPAAVG